jgi:hypothetical protein
MHWLSLFFYIEAKFGPLDKRIKKRLTSVELKFFRRTAGYTLFDHKINEKIFEGLNVEAVDEKLGRCKSNWLRHATRMNNNGMPKIVLNYRPNGPRRLGRPLKRLLDEAQTGLSRPDP